METLKEVAQEWIEEKIADGYTKQEAIDELMSHGCQSGMVSGLIYYTDTTKFFEAHKAEINELLKEVLSSTGLDTAELFGDKWDTDDPLCMDTTNQNLLAWFGFEETVRALGEDE